MTLLDDVNTLLLPHVLIRARAAHYPHEVKSLPIRSAPAPNEREKSLSLSFGISRDDDLLLQAGILLLIVKVRNVVDQQQQGSTLIPPDFPRMIWEAPPFLYIPSVCTCGPHDSGSTNEIPFFPVPVDPFHLLRSLWKQKKNSARIDVIGTRSLLLRSSPSLYTVSEPRLD